MRICLLAIRFVAGNIEAHDAKTVPMGTTQQPESEDEKLRERLTELFHHARALEAALEAPANLPRIQEPARPALPMHESFLPGSILTTLFRNPKTSRTVAFKAEELTELDGMSSDYL